MMASSVEGSITIMVGVMIVLKNLNRVLVVLTSSIKYSFSCDRVSQVKDSKSRTSNGFAEMKFRHL